MITARVSTKLGRNEPCHCGSGHKYKQCHLPEDEERHDAELSAARAAADAGDRAHNAHRCARYVPVTRKIPAASRVDFKMAVRNLANQGAGGILHVDSPLDLAKDQGGVDEALALVEQHGLRTDFARDPNPDLIDATTTVLDGLFGRGVFAVKPSGVRLKKYTQSEMVRNEANGNLTIYLSGRGSVRPVVFALFSAVLSDAEQLGIPGGPLARVWAGARVIRELTMNYLGLPVLLRERGADLLEATLSQASEWAEEVDSNGASRESVSAAAMLPYLIGLPEALGSPRAALSGMGLPEQVVESIVARFEDAAAGPEYLRRVAMLAGDDWETAEGYQSWLAEARTVPAIVALENSAPAVAPQLPPMAGSPVELAVPPGTGSSSAEPARESSLLSPPRLFDDLDRVEAMHAENKEGSVAQADTLASQCEVLTQRQASLQTELVLVEAELRTLALSQAKLDFDVENWTIAALQDRNAAIVEILTRGASALNEIDFPSELHSPVNDDDRPLAESERIVAEHEAMERSGILNQLPPFYRATADREAELAMSLIREQLGGREPVNLPVFIGAEGGLGPLVLTIGLPLGGGDDLAPQSIHTAVASAVATAVVETAGSMPGALIRDVEHEILVEGVSLLSLSFQGPPTETADDCAQYLAICLEDKVQSNPLLQRARIGIHTRVEPELASLLGFRANSS